MSADKVPLPARNFPSAEEEARAVGEASRYAGPESAYRLAFTDTAFLLREELRPVPATSFSASAACTLPTMPTSGANTPIVEQATSS